MNKPEPLHMLLVEDDPSFGAVLKSYLELNGYRVNLCENGRQGLNAFKNHSFDLCLLDVMMPEMDGFSLAKEIRKQQQIPFIFITAKALKDDIVEGFKLGADDYITKPFDSEVLLYKIKAILNRGKSVASAVESFKIGSFTFNTRLRSIQSHEGNTQKLSPKETALLKMLCEHMDTVLSREDALNAIWGEHNYFTARSMDVFITKLRKYLKQDAKVEIVNIHGDGFRLIVDA